MENKPLTNDLRYAILEYTDAHTNDPATQARLVKVLNIIEGILNEKEK